MKAAQGQSVAAKVDVLTGVAAHVFPAGGDKDKPPVGPRNASTHSMIWRRRADCIKSIVHNWHTAVAISSWFAPGYLKAIYPVFALSEFRDLPGELGHW